MVNVKMKFEVELEDSFEDDEFDSLYSDEEICSGLEELLKEGLSSKGKAKVKRAD